LTTFVIPGYTTCMKTAISVPDATFDAVNRRVRELGLNRSEFFSIAAQHYLDELDRLSLTAQIDEALTIITTDSESAAATRAGRARLAAESDW
jgi:metal-responsive CopG/Arc/MetJ family transcriptional regulator